MREVKSAMKDMQQVKRQNSGLEHDLRNAQAQLQEAVEARDAANKRWKKVASELNKLRAQPTELYQLTDSDLVESVKQLRHEIRSFSVQYSAGKTLEQSQKPADNEFWQYVVPEPQAEAISAEHLAILRTEATEPMVIQSFLWGTLVSKVFEQFLWVPPPYDKSIAAIYQVLKPCR